jgi:hypothetical protein
LYFSHLLVNSPRPFLSPSLILGPVCVLDDCFAFDFAIIECGCDFDAVGQLKHALALLHIILVLAFVFEVAVRETVQAFAVALLRLPVQFAFVVIILVQIYLELLFGLQVADRSRLHIKSIKLEIKCIGIGTADAPQQMDRIFHKMYFHCQTMVQI